MLNWKSSGESDCGQYAVRDACWYFGRDDNGNMLYMGRSADPKRACEEHNDRMKPS